MDEMRIWDGLKESSKKKLVRSTWAAHVEKSSAHKGRGRPELRWGIALKVT